MATLTCNNKGCYKTTSDSLLDEITNEVICSECGKPITNVSDFTKRSMRGIGKIKKAQSKLAFTVDCDNCKRRGQPIIINDEPHCYNCKQKLNLSTQFLLIFQEYLKNLKSSKDDNTNK